MAEDSWRGHSFTLLIFVGVVVLCSIFFILGMLVGSSQTGMVEETAFAEEVPPPEELQAEDLELSFYEAVEDSEPEPLETRASVMAAEPVVASRPAPPARAAAIADTPTIAITLQIAALSNADQAETLRQQLTDEGYPAFILRPAPQDRPALHRVQVGPYDDETEVARIRALLEAEGYEPITRN